METRVPPSEERARRLVLTITAFWTAGALSHQVPSPFGVLILLPGLACGVVFFFTVSQVAAEGTGFGPWDFWNGIPGHSRVPAEDRQRHVLALLTPRWWKDVVAATGWPRALVWLVLAGTLAAALISTALGFGS